MLKKDAVNKVIIAELNGSYREIKKSLEKIIQISSKYSSQRLLKSEGEKYTFTLNCKTDDDFENLYKKLEEIL